MFHICMESAGRLLKHQQFRDCIEVGELGKSMLVLPVRRIVDEVTETGTERNIARAAMRWRGGNSYYGFLREVFSIVMLRSQGVDVRAHPRADSLFRADAWVGRSALSLCIGNRKYLMGEDAGHQGSPERLLADVYPPIHFEEIELPAATRFGQSPPALQR